MNREGILKYRADIRPLAYVAVTLASSLLPFVVNMPIWALVPYWGISIWLHSFCPYAQHNHGHLPAFNAGWLNRLYDRALCLVTGYPTSLWELHHNRGHHRHFLTPELDVARVTSLRTGRVVSQPWYALRGNLTIHRDSIRIGREEEAAGRKSLLPKLYSDLAFQALALTALAFVNPWMTFLFFVIPMAAMAWAIWWESYPHHLHVPGTEIYDASVTIENDRFNRGTFNIGHHTAHHEKPTLHWSLLPQRTLAIRERIPASCVRDGRGPGRLVPVPEPLPADCGDFIKSRRDVSTAVVEFQ